MLNKLSLQNFRSYAKKTFEFNPGATLIIGPNAVGKTNVLEAIYYLATGKSLRAENESEVIRETADSLQTTDYGKVARVMGQTGSELESQIARKLESTTELEIIWDARERFHKLYRVNGVGKRQIDFVGHLRAVLFQPIDLEIIIGSPSVRRKYLDEVLSQVHREYRVAHHIYEKALRQRNRLLYRIKKQELGLKDVLGQLEYWDQLLIDNGRIIHDHRREYINFVNDHTDNFFALELSYDHSIISTERLEKYRSEEFLSGTTLVGPHRDDFIINFKSKSKFKFTRELSKYGSRGEERLGVFTLKIAEVDYVEKITSQRPILLLDDIFSELDSENRHHVFEFIRRQQTVMTTTDVHPEEKKYLEKIEALKIRLT